MKRNNNRGQALVEYVLLAVVFLAVTYGVVRLFGSAWTTKFDKIQYTRAGIGGIGP
jgi:Flp pilus assembly pilin Flp